MSADQLEMVFAARDEAIARVNRSADQWERDVVDQAILAHCELGRPFSANDFRDSLPQITNRNLIGGRLKAMAQTKNPPYRAIGTVTSTDVGTHAKKINLYLRSDLVERAA